MQAKPLTVLRLQREMPHAPHTEPVSAGIPLRRGVLHDPAALVMQTARGEPLPCHATALARWPDGSVRWALIDILHRANGEREVQVGVAVAELIAPVGASIDVGVQDASYLVDTGALRFALPRDVFAPFSQLRSTRDAASLTASAELRVEAGDGRPLQPCLERLDIETAGPLRLTFAGGGVLRGAPGSPDCRFAVRLSSFAGSALLRLDFTVHNPRAARHRHGLWDLGDPGSILLRSLSIGVRPSAPGALSWRALPSGPLQRADSAHVEIFQASSGGEQWASRNHRDRTGGVPLPFRGCRIRDGARVTAVDRASPTLLWHASDGCLGVARTGFWQEFPSALEGTADELRVGLFPAQADAPFELQGGERKTFTVFFCIGAEADADLAWVHDRSVVTLPPEYVAASGAVAHLVPACDDPHADYRRLVAEALDGPHSFFAKREAIDEYGWRNFGDTWADHEQQYYSGERPLISHYNNQYDLVHGFLLHFAASGDRRWFDLAAALARHVVDIDLYHTAADKPAYNGGQFWHTAHYDDAGRATHRSYSADSPRAVDRRRYGGGPSCENVYTTGLRYFHYLTGDPAARAAVLQLADWIVRMDDGSESLLDYVAPGPTGLASYTRTFDYCGPGRGPGNAINTLLDAHCLDAAAGYLAKAEELIARCVHPRDDPARHRLDDAENRWSYTMFFQALGKYLDLKCELGQPDRAFAYARASLARYADWMLAHETPFAARFDRLEYPTESWPAQDVRKSCVFDYAAQYGPVEQRAAMSAAAERFFAESVRGVLSFDTRACARPLAVMLANGMQRARFRLHPPAAPSSAGESADFGRPSEFQPQTVRFRAQLATPGGWVALARAGLRPAVWRRLLSGRIW